MGLYEPQQHAMRFAHFENVSIGSLEHLYMRHAEVCRDIYQDRLRKFTGNNDLTVDLIKKNGFEISEGRIDDLKTYDVVSVSSGSTPLFRLGARPVGDISDFEKVEPAIGGLSDTVYVEAAGNFGESRGNGGPRYADFMSTALVVGEATSPTISFKPFIEEHSSIRNPTLACDSPFNRAEKFQFFDPSPSLVGHQELVENWLSGQEMIRRVEGLAKDRGANLEDQSALIELYREVDADMMAENYTDSDDFKDTVQHYMKNPEELHVRVLDALRKDMKIDDRGFVHDVDGTSFSSPECAGYVSGALYIQAQREAKGLPSLNKTEILTLVKLATVDIDRREGQEALMPQFKNTASFACTDYGGHGVFQPIFFKNLLKATYQRLDENPEIDRTIVKTTMRPIEGEHDGTLTMQADTNGQDILIDTMRMDVRFLDKEDYTHDFSIRDAHGHVTPLYADLGVSGNELRAWARVETEFGEHVTDGQQWVISDRENMNFDYESGSIDIQGYLNGGLMSEMMTFAQDAVELSNNTHTQINVPVYGRK